MNASPAEDGETDKSAREALPQQGQRTWNSHQLLGEKNEAWIVHGGEVYRLLRTRNDKLILVK